jgi:hypothetical protein
MKTLTNKQKEYFDFIKEWSPNKFNGNPNNYKDVCDYITRNKEAAHSNYYLSTRGNSAYL